LTSLSPDSVRIVDWPTHNIGSGVRTGPHIIPPRALVIVLTHKCHFRLDIIWFSLSECRTRPWHRPDNGFGYPRPGKIEGT
jgi:hypothetical protein